MPCVIPGAGEKPLGGGEWGGTAEETCSIPHPGKIHNGLVEFLSSNGYGTLEEDGTSEVGSVLGVDLES